MSLSTTITALQQAKTDIYDAIVAKGGEVSPGDGFSDFASGIETITGSPVVEEKDVNFYDYDGKLLHSYTLAEAQSLAALPASPDHSSDTVPLTFQEWNYTLAQVNALTDKANIGATYIPTDGKTHLTIDIAELGRMVVPLYFNQTVSNGVTIDWGDGSLPETFTGTGNKNTTHTYSAAGTYEITLDVTSGALRFGANSSSYCVMGSTGNNGRVYCNMLKSVRIGNSVKTMGAYAFYNCYSLASVTIPNTATIGIGSYAFGYCYSLASVTIPNSLGMIDYATFQYCYSLASVTIPNSVSLIDNYTFQYCHSLASVTIPNTVTIIYDNAFYNCYSLASVTIPNSVETINESTFYSCYSLASVTISNTVTKIYDNAFYNCHSLASVTIPNTVTKIYDNAFYNCIGMAHYYVYCTTPPDLASEYVFDNIPSDCVIHVPAASLSAYQSATNWSAHAAKMVGDL